jgi:hypothetical protein
MALCPAVDDLPPATAPAKEGEVAAILAQFVTTTTQRYDRVVPRVGDIGE